MLIKKYDHLMNKATLSVSIEMPPLDITKTKALKSANKSKSKSP